MAIPIVALLPNVKESFSSHPDECLSDSAFNQRYGNNILALYKFDDLDSMEKAEEEEEWSGDDIEDDIEL